MVQRAQCFFFKGIRSSAARFPIAARSFFGGEVNLVEVASTACRYKTFSTPFVPLFLRK